jgi:hypothetical protein
MSMSIVDHVRGKSQSKSSARILLLDLAIYANDCCGVAWPGDTTLYHDVNVSRQRIHEVKNALEDTGELVILERPGDTNLYLVAWQGTPLGGTSAEKPGEHDRRCPLRDPARWDRCARRWPDRYPPLANAGEGSEFSDTPAQMVAPSSPEIPDPQGSDFSDTTPLNSLPQKQEKSFIDNVNVDDSRQEANDEPPEPVSIALSPYEEEIVEHGVQKFNDAHSRRFYHRAIRVVGDQVFYALMQETWALRSGIRCLGAYFTDQLKRAATRQGKALGRATRPTTTPALVMSVSPTRMETDRPRCRGSNGCAQPPCPHSETHCASHGGCPDCLAAEVAARRLVPERRT